MNKKIIKFSILLAVLAIVGTVIYFSFGKQKNIKRLDVLVISGHSTIEEFNQVSQRWILQDFSDSRIAGGGVVRDLTIGKYTATCYFKNSIMGDLTCLGDDYKEEKQKEWAKGFREKYGTPLVDKPLEIAWCDEEGNTLIIKEGSIKLRKYLPRVDCNGEDFTPPPPSPHF